MSSNYSYQEEATLFQSMVFGLTTKDMQILLKHRCGTDRQVDAIRKKCQSLRKEYSLSDENGKPNKTAVMQFLDQFIKEHNLASIGPLTNEECALLVKSNAGSIDC